MASYSQGVAVGDYNADGFPDLYLGNIGPNRLYQNNGDGTFRDVTREAGVAGGNRWTTSCAIVDLNGDAMPDIYAVHYAPLEEVLARHCGETRSAACSPTMFSGEQDRLFQNKGDGTFRDVTDESGILDPDGKGLGLGIVAAAFDGTGRIDLFVGNDTTANFFFVNQTDAPGRPLSFLDQGIVFGSAYNEHGQGQACMGIAAGDPNGDGLLDLFVSNFFADSNTLYRATPGARRSATTPATQDLREPSFNMLCFGTQFLDAELDGWPDIIISNGHVDRQHDTGIPDRMPAQYFQNLGEARFVELYRRLAGPLFREGVPGAFRGRARLESRRKGGRLHLPPRCSGCPLDQSDAGYGTLSRPHPPRRRRQPRRDRIHPPTHRGRPDLDAAEHRRNRLPGQQRAEDHLRTRPGRTGRSTPGPLAVRDRRDLREPRSRSGNRHRGRGGTSAPSLLAQIVHTPPR